MEESFCLPPLSKALVTTYASSIESPLRLAGRGICGIKFTCRPNQWRSKTPIALFSFFLVSTTFTGCGARYTVTSTGIGSFQASTDAVEFGSVVVGQIATSSVTLVNQGPAAIQVSALTVTGNDFAVTNPNSFPVSVAANSTYTVAVQFKPKSNGDSSGQFTVSSTSITSPSLKIKLHGKGALAPVASSSLVLSSFSCSQGSMTGSGSDACTVNLSGTAGTGGYAVSLSSSSGAVTVPQSITVPAGAASAGFSAAVSAVNTAQTATLTASAGGVAKTYAVVLGAAGASLTLSTTALSFGTVNLNSPATQPLVVTSSGTATLTIAGGSVSGSGFSISGMNFPVSLNPGQTATLYVQFDPTAAGTTSGNLTVTSNATNGSTATISLSGTGQTISYQVLLNWSAPTNSSDPIAGYNVYRATGGGSSYQLLNASVNQPTTYSDTSVQSGASYNYYVESVDAHGNQSSPSNTYSVSIP
jgi:hypothetical protein